MFGFIMIAVLAILGAIMFFAPRLGTRADKRDDPEAVAQVKKGGLMVIVFAIGAGLLLLKYEIF